MLTGAFSPQRRFGRTSKGRSVVTTCMHIGMDTCAAACTPCGAARLGLMSQTCQRKKCAGVRNLVLSFDCGINRLAWCLYVESQ